MINEDMIYFDIDLNSKEEVFSFICLEAFKHNITNDEKLLLEDFHQREKEFSTGLQDGFAIPHARSDNVNKITIMFIRLKKGIDWESLDDKPVQYIFALLVPKASAKNVHLQMISNLATCLLENDFKNKIKSCSSKKELVRYIIQEMEEN